MFAIRLLACAWSCWIFHFQISLHFCYKCWCWCWFLCSHLTSSDVFFNIIPPLPCPSWMCLLTLVCLHVWLIAGSFDHWFSKVLFLWPVLPQCLHQILHRLEHTPVHAKSTDRCDEKMSLCSWKCSNFSRIFVRITRLYETASWIHETSQKELIPVRSGVRVRTSIPNKNNVQQSYLPEGNCLLISVGTHFRKTHACINKEMEPNEFVMHLSTTIQSALHETERQDMR